MSRTDLIADVFTLIRNANRAHKEKVDVPGSKMVERILGVLKQEGYIENYKFIKDNRQGLFRVYLRFIDSKTPVLTDIQRVSKPGLRKYGGYSKLPKVLNGMGVALVSTSKGILTDQDCRKMHLGGEIIGFVW